ncbi:MAG: hypothetical protein M5U01_10635 [Ardenticatenaceae bacterium]|nr:hypothetical protein [Ardenticatenaceae bacterium]
MSQLQAFAVHWLSVLVLVLPVGYAFGAGMIAAVNPCGFAMLPAYLSLYLGLDEKEKVGRLPGARLEHRSSHPAGGGKRLPKSCSQPVPASVTVVGARCGPARSRPDFGRLSPCPALV